MTIKIEKFITGTAQTWTKESWAQEISLILIGGGGPGGDGWRWSDGKYLEWFGRKRRQ
jgi:hypothetical protein